MNKESRNYLYRRKKFIIYWHTKWYWLREAKIQEVLQGYYAETLFQLNRHIDGD